MPFVPQMMTTLTSRVILAVILFCLLPFFFPDTAKRSITPSVAIIGAGAAGLVTCKTLRDAGIVATVFECSSRVGGVWKYEDKKLRRGPMYKSLVTNLPVEIMEINSGVTYSVDNLPTTSSYIGHEKALKYLEKYAEDENLYPIIRFDTTVLSVRKTSMYSNIFKNFIFI